MGTRVGATHRRWSRSLARPGSWQERVHAARIVLKEARAVVRLYRNGPTAFDAVGWGKRLRTAAQALAPARDGTVTRTTLLKIAESLPSVADREVVTRALPQPQPADAAALRAVAPLVQELVHEWRSMVVPAGWASVDRALAASRRALAQQQARAGRTEAAEVWHRWRRRAKEFAFQLDWVQPVDQPKWRRLREEAWRLQSHLGELQDLHVARERLGGLNVPKRVARALKRSLRQAAREASHRAWHDRLRRRDLRGE